ncbi:MAG: methyltransferase domain-containing protein [Candidatus Paceibacterota bacterium]
MEAFDESQTEAYYDSFSDVYEAVWNQQIHTGLFDIDKTLAQAVQDMNLFLAHEAGLAPNTKVLAVGSGRGGTDRMLAKGQGAKVVGLDISKKQVGVAKQRAKEAGLENRISYTHGSMTAIPLKGGQFDYVWAQESFFHCHNKPKAVSEFSRVIKPGGLVVIEDTLLLNPDARQEVLNTFGRRVKINNIGTPKEYTELFAEENFDLEKSIDLSADLLKTYEAIIAFITENKKKLREMLPQKYHAMLEVNFGFDESLKLTREKKLGCYAFFFRKK